MNKASGGDEIPVERFQILKVDVFVEFPGSSYNPANIGNLISGFSAFSKSILYVWKLLVHILLKPSLKDFEHYLLVCEMGTIV